MKIIIACGVVVLVIICLVINHQKNKKKKDEIVKFIQNLSLDDFDFILSKKKMQLKYQNII